MWLPSGGSLVIDRTEAMTVVDVNTGKFTGQGGNLEETVTRNNLEAAEEIVRQLRLRDVGGIVVIDFIDMVLESNRELVLRRLLECLARDRTKHQVAEVTSLGLVQMTRKRVGAGLLEAFSQQCECCNGRGVIVTLDAPAEPAHRASAGTAHRPVPTPPPHDDGNGHGASNGNGRSRGNGGDSRPSNGRSGNRRSGGRRTTTGAPRCRHRGHDLDDTARGDAALEPTALRHDRPRRRAGQQDPQRHRGRGPCRRRDLRAGHRRSERRCGRGHRRRRGQPQRRQAHPPPDQRRHRLRRRRPRRGVAGPAAVVPVVTSVSETAPEPAGFTSVAAGNATPTEEAEPAVRRTRTRAGSAVARVTIVSDPEPTAPADPESAPDALTPTATELEIPAADAEATPEAITATEPTTATEQTTATESAAPAAGAAIPDAPAEPQADLEAPAEVADVPAFEAADAFTAPSEPATEQAPADPDAPAAQEQPTDEPAAPEPDALAVAEEPATEQTLPDVSPFEAADAFTTPADPADEPPAAEPDHPADPNHAPDAAGEAPSFVVDAAGEASPIAQAAAEAEGEALPEVEAEGETSPGADAEGEA